MSSSEADVVKEALREGLMQIWKEESEDHVRQVGEYYPSNIGYCLRKQYYDYVLAKPPAVETLAVFATGKGIHEAVAEALSKSDKVKIEHVELPVHLQINDFVRLTGRIDVLIAEVMGKRAILEVKSTSKIPDEPHYTHMLQLQAYLHAMSLETGLLLYWDKRSGEIECFTVQKDPAWLQKIGERAIMLDQYLRSNVAPHREAFMEGKYWECDRCSYYAECQPFALENTDPESKLALLGITVHAEYAKIELVSPTLQELKDICQKRKQLGEKVIILFDADSSQLDRLSELLEKAKIMYDVLIPQPSSYKSATFWKLELARRLAKNYRIVYYADSSDFPEDEAIKFSASTERLGSNNRQYNKSSHSKTQPY
ncbi:MAG: PD-(D/E)XK nuclease family protein [Conexivisphaerales archaeon]